MSVINTVIRGYVYDYSSIEISVEGKRNFCTVSEINYNWSREIGVMRGNGSPMKRGRTRGEFDFEASLSMTKADAREFQLMLAALGFGSFGEAIFDIFVTYASLDQSKPITDSLIGCTLKGGDNSHSRSPDALMVKYDLDLMNIKYDGLSPVAGDDVTGTITGAVGNLIGAL